MSSDLATECRNRTSSRAALDRAACLIGKRAGIVRRIYSNVRGQDDPFAIQAYAEPSRIDTFSVVPGSNRGAACDLTQDDAAIRALGECVERYCGALYDPQTFRAGSYSEFSRQGVCALDPAQLVLFSDEQYGSSSSFPFMRFDRNTQTLWKEGVCAATGQSTYLPASFVYVPYRYDMTYEQPFHMPISTGLAAGQSLRDAIVKGIMEILERDAFMVAWRNGLGLKELDLSSFEDPAIDQLRSASAMTGGTWRAFVLPSDIPVPIVMTLLVNEHGLPKTSFGASADISPSRAIAGAMKESLLTRYYINFLMRSRPSVVRQVDCADYEWVRTLEDHAIAHAFDHRLRNHIDNLGEGQGTLDCAKVDGEPLDYLIARLKDSGFDMFYCDVTTSDVRHAGIHVARVIIPGMQPLDNDHRYPYEGGRRLFTLPVRLGLREREISPVELSRLPHPFP